MEGVGASSSSATRHFGQRYRQLCAQRDRSAEEVGILHCEVLRLCNGLEERTALIEANLAELQPAGGDDDIGADRCNATHAWPAQLIAGKTAALRAELLRLQLILVEVNNLRAKHL